MTIHLPCFVFFTMFYGLLETANANFTASDVRLVGGASSRYGRLEVRHMDEWGTICTYGYDSVDARVACRMLGYQYGIAITHIWRPIMKIADGSNKIWIRDLGCKGHEVSLAHCRSRKWGEISPCKHQFDSGAICLNTTDVFINRNHYGNVMVYAQTWKSVCGVGWDDADARVVCREFGWSSGEAYSDSEFGRPTTQLWTNVNCSGSEGRLGDCPRQHLGHASHCHGYRTAGVVCYDDANVTEPHIELRTPDYKENCAGYSCGRASVVYKGVWGSICDDDWTNEDATVLCKTKGYEAGTAVCCGGFLNSLYPTPIWYRNPTCAGNESTFFDCPAADKRGVGYSQSACRHVTSEVGAICYNLAEPEFIANQPKIYLGGTGQTYGYVLVKYRGVWGHVSDKDWTAAEALIVCREVNPAFTVAIPFCCTMFGFDKNRPNLMFEPKCRGDEKSIFECPHAGWANQSLTKEWKRKEVVGVRCLMGDVAGAPLQFKLSHERIGSALVYYAEYWGNICSDNWTHTEAASFCRQFGYNGGHVNHFPGGTNIIMARDVNCSGAPSFANCTLKTGVFPECVNKRAGALCFNNSEKRLRLRGGGFGFGRLELAVDEEWGTICHHHFGKACADATCRLFGYSQGLAIGSARYGPGKGRIWLRVVNCVSASRFFWENKHYGWGHEYYCNHNIDVSVYCYDPAVCNEVKEMSGYHGQLLSNSWPAWYSVNCEQSWRITVQPGFRICLVINYMKITESANCTAHALRVYDGLDVTGHLLGAYCGTRSRFSVWSTGGAMFVTFKATAGTGAPGFYAQYSAECVGRFVWQHTDRGRNITGRAYETVDNVTSWRQCLSACDASIDACVEVYVDMEAGTCYLHIPNLYGWANLSVSGLHVYSRRCKSAGCHGKITWVEIDDPTQTHTSGHNDVIRLPDTSLDACKTYCASANVDCLYLAHATESRNCFIKTTDLITESQVTMPKEGVTYYAWNCLDCQRKYKETEGGRFSSVEHRISPVWHAKSLEQCRAFCSTNVRCEALDYREKTQHCFIYTTSATSLKASLHVDADYRYLEFNCGVRSSSARCKQEVDVVNSLTKPAMMTSRGLSLECLAMCHVDALCNSVTMSAWDQSEYTWTTDVCQLNYHYATLDNNYTTPNANRAVCQMLYTYPL